MYKSGQKIALMDLDRLLGDFSEGAKELGVEEIYKRCWDDPELLLKEIKNYDPKEIEEKSKKLVESFKVYPETIPFLKEMKNRNFHNAVLTDNFLCGSEENKKKIMKNFSDGKVCYVDEIYCTMEMVEEGGKTLIKPNGSKEEFAKKRFEIYNSGILIVEGRNDVKVALEIRKFAREKRFPVKIIKVGDNCKELNEFVDYSVENLYDALNFIDEK